MDVSVRPGHFGNLDVRSCDIPQSDREAPGRGSERASRMWKPCVRQIGDPFDGVAVSAGFVPVLDASHDYYTCVLVISSSLFRGGAVLVLQ